MKVAAASSATYPPLKAVITLNGQTYEYDEGQGTNLGDFVGEIGGFTQGCVRATCAGSPITVFFRPDRTSGRAEVVFELGQLFSGTPVNLGAYSVVISRGGQTLATVAVPAHYWFSRWRWQSAPRPVVAKVSDLIVWNLLPPYAVTSAGSTGATTTGATTTGASQSAATPTTYSGAGATGSLTKGTPAVTSTAASTVASTTAVAADPTAAAVYTIMGLAGVTAYMPQTGERPDIGPVTEPQGQYICTGDANALATVLAQGEAAGTVPWHLRDENTGAPISFNTYPKASWYPDSSGGGAPQIKGTVTPITIDSAHVPALAYVPYLLTGDPYFLEELQFMANWDWGCMPVSYRPNISQARQFAWSLRNLMQAARITPSGMPSWLMPATYFYARLEGIREWFEANFVNSPRPERLVFRCCTPIDSSQDNGPTAPVGTWVDFWEDEFVATIMGWGITMGFTDWQDAFAWKIGSTIARTNGTSGWIRAQATPYRSILRYTATSAFAANWAGAYQITANLQQLTYTDPNTWSTPDMTYLAYSRGSLAYAVQFGIPGASACFTWASGQIAAKSWDTDYKWRINS